MPTLRGPAQPGPFGALQDYVHVILLEDSVTRYDGEAVRNRSGDNEPVARVPVDQGKLRCLQANCETERQHLKAVMMKHGIEPQAWKCWQDQLPLPMLQADFEAGYR